jgi:hypothetical protein
MPLMPTRGAKGRFRVSGVEFESLDATSDTSTLRLRGLRETIVVKDSKLRELADQIESDER